MKKIFAIFIIAILTMGAGYEGTLPDLESELSYKIKSKYFLFAVESVFALGNPVRAWRVVSLRTQA